MMANFYFSLCSFFLLFSLQAKAQVPVLVVDSENTRYQLEREVITRWNKFDPKWYFVLFHNNYRKGEDRRKLLQLAPTLWALRTNQNMAEQQEQHTDVVYQQEMFKAADRSLNKGYHLLYSLKIEAVNNQLNVLHLEATQAGVNTEMLLKLLDQRDRINADISIILDAYEADAVKGESFRGYLKELSSLRGYYRRLISLFHRSHSLTTEK